ncbi:MAG: ribosome biogenesis GTPase YlqF [Syntrophomonadaceae bacterium]|nr:ribosome biogenesis GTPase YlqF [Syntrophomonadaceae bacterium]
MQIHWYPGHMAKTRRLLKEKLKLVDLVIELADARIPLSSRNPEFDSLLDNKPRLLLLTKADLAEPAVTQSWCIYFQQDGLNAMAVDLLSKSPLHGVIPAVESLAEGVMQRLEAAGKLRRPARAMVAGIPNVGKSQLINKLSGKASVRVENRPGVTRGYQWIRLGKQIDLMDSPGMLWPKIEDQQTGFKLALIGAIPQDILDNVELALELLRLLLESYPSRLIERYGIQVERAATPLLALEMIGRSRGLLKKGGIVDAKKAAEVLLQEFRTGKLGRFSLEQKK